MPSVDQLGPSLRSDDQPVAVGQEEAALEDAHDGAQLRFEFLGRLDPLEPAVDEGVAAVGRIDLAVIVPTDLGPGAEGLEASLGVLEAKAGDLDGDRAGSAQGGDPLGSVDEVEPTTRDLGDELLA